MPTTWPATVECPLCGQDALRIFSQDTRSPYGWHYCHGCRSGGTLIDLAARCWKIPALEALQRLRSPDELRRRRYERYRWGTERIRDLWGAARQSPLTAAAVEQLRRWELWVEMSPQRWEEGPGRLLGFSTNKETEMILHPGSSHRGCRASPINPVRVPDGHNPSPRRLFHGKGWRSVIVTPGFFHPQQPACLHFYGREGRPLEDHVLYAPRHNSTGVEVGLVGLGGIGPETSEVVAIQDPLLLLRLQMRHFCSAVRPLPLVAWDDSPRGRTQVAWDMLRGRRVVFVAQQPSEALLRQLVLTEGELLLGQVTWSRVVPAALKKARPWRDALAHWCWCQPERVRACAQRWLETIGEPALSPGRRRRKVPLTPPSEGV